MATFVAIPEKTQTKTAMKKVLDYVMQDKKTLYENPDTHKNYKLISGQNCVPETAFREFMNTKKQYKKDHGVFFKQYVQSFKPDCGATPDQIHAMGVELAKSFDGFEVVVATHIDADHWHNHLVANSVNCETGLKIQINEKDLEQLRTRSDEICQEFGFETLKPYEKPKQKAMNQREYRSALKGNSWKMKLLSAIEKSMNVSNSKEQFIGHMKKLGYDVKWINHYKYITYTTSDGKKCRDNRLYDDKYLKTNMEVYFNELEQVNGNKRGNQRGANGAVSANIDWSQARPMERSGTPHNDGRDRTVQEHRPDIPIADTGANRRINDTRGEEELQLDGTGSQERNEQDFGIDKFSDSEFDEISREYDDEYEFEYDGTDENEGFDTVENQSKVDHDWGDIANSVIALGASIEAMVNNDDNDRKKQQKKQKRQGKSHKKKQQHKDDYDLSM